MIAPWLVGTDVIGAAKAGASLGLEARGQNIQASEAGDKLRLAYDQLAASAAEHQQTVEAHRQSALAAMQLKAQQASALEQYRQSEIAQQNAREQLAQHKQDAAMQLQSSIQEHSRNVLTGMAKGGDLKKLVADNPLAVHDPAVKTMWSEGLKSEKKLPNFTPSVQSFEGVPAIQVSPQHWQVLQKPSSDPAAKVQHEIDVGRLHSLRARHAIMSNPNKLTPAEDLKGIEGEISKLEKSMINRAKGTKASNTLKWNPDKKDFDEPDDEESGGSLKRIKELDPEPAPTE